MHLRKMDFEKHYALVDFQMVLSSSCWRVANIETSSVSFVMNMDHSGPLVTDPSILCQF